MVIFSYRFLVGKGFRICNYYYYLREDRELAHEVSGDERPSVDIQNGFSGERTKALGRMKVVLRKGEHGWQIPAGVSRDSGLPQRYEEWG